MTQKTEEARVLSLAREKGILRVLDLRKQGIHPEHLRRLHQKGLLIRAGRGLYTPSGVEISGNHGMALASKWIPRGVVCLLSALSYHEIGTQQPRQVWIALPPRSARPKLQYPPLRIATFSGRALTEGVEPHKIDGVNVRIYKPAKTVADCFKYRNKIGLDVALEALRECKRLKKCTNDDLWRYAKICRVWNVMRPYLEAMG